MTLEDDMATIGPGGVEAANRKHPMTQAPKERAIKSGDKYFCPNCLGKIDGFCCPYCPTCDQSYDLKNSIKVSEDFLILKSIEWSGYDLIFEGTSYGGYRYCPVCKSKESKGHRSGCGLQRIISNCAQNRKNNSGVPP